MKKIFSLAFILFLFTTALNAQVFNNPISGKQSHPELEITKIEITSTKTIINLKVTNKLSQGGWFCADERIYIKNSKGIERYELVNAENIPTCPDKYDFSYSGQTLEFVLYFPPIANEIKFIDLIESCSNACFSFQGIILDNEHNENIRQFEKGFEFYQNKENEKSIPHFEHVVATQSSIDSHIYGLSYYYLVLIFHELENKEQSDYWFDKLINSTVEDKTTFIKELEKLGIKK